MKKLIAILCLIASASYAVQYEIIVREWNDAKTVQSSGKTNTYNVTQSTNITALIASIYTNGTPAGRVARLCTESIATACTEYQRSIIRAFLDSQTRSNRDAAITRESTIIVLPIDP